MASETENTLEGTDFKPQSRMEEFLVAMTTEEKETDLPAPRSRVESLLKQVADSGSSPSSTDAVLYTPQTLTDAQKAQARVNIGAGNGLTLQSIALLINILQNANYKADVSSQIKLLAEELMGGGNADTGSFNITDDGNGNVTITASGSASITDDGEGNVTITASGSASITDDGNGNVVIT